tara:strand:+ start:8595 stop:10250 length:1656 start_codon:yes stop_codon:yes gene_type:complete
MANILFTNFAQSLLATGIDDVATTIAVDPGHGARFPAITVVGDFFYITLENVSLEREIVKVTARVVDTMTVVRAQDNTTAYAWNAGDPVALRVNAAAIEYSLAAARLAADEAVVSATESANSAALSIANEANVNAVAANATNINAAVANATDITTVAGINAAVTTVAGISADATAVAGNAANVTAAAGNATNINAAVANATNINAAVANATDITTVAGINAAVTTVAGVNAAVTTVAGVSANTTTVAGIAANVTTVAGIASNVTAVAGNAANINAAVANATNINAVAGIDADVTTVASNISAILDAPTQASDAAASAVSAAQSAASAATLLDNFDDRYLGAKASSPALDNDGDALIVGALYFNTTDGVMNIYAASGWLAASSASVGTLATYEFVATSGQTAFVGNDANGVSLNYTAPSLLVTLNGVRLRPGDDYTATDGVTVTLVTGAATGDELVIDAFGNFLIADVVSRAAGGTFQAAVNVLGNMDAASFTVSGAPLEAGAKNGIFWENEQVVTADYTITAGRNAGTFGAVTIASGITVTVPTGSRWVIV